MSLRPKVKRENEMEIEMNFSSDCFHQNAQIAQMKILFYLKYFLNNSEYSSCKISKLKRTLQNKESRNFVSLKFLII